MYCHYHDKPDIFRQSMTFMYVYFFAGWYYPLYNILTTQIYRTGKRSHTKTDNDEVTMRVSGMNKVCNMVFRHFLPVQFDVRGTDIIEDGVILSNHVSMIDGAIDSYLQDAHVVARMLGVAVSGLMGALARWENRGIIIRRGKTSSHELASCILAKLATPLPLCSRLSCDKRVLIYPEGTRKRYYFASFFDTSNKPPKLLLEEFFMSKIIEKEQNRRHAGFLTSELIRTNMRFGTCLTLYDMSPNTRFQIVISRNKEIIFQNKPCTVHIYRGKVFRPSDFLTKELFMDHIVAEWMRCCKEASFPCC